MNIILGQSSFKSRTDSPNCVDAIVGHHPHVVQPFECYRTARDPARIVPIYYSLGNLTTPFSAAFTCRSAVARFTLVKGLNSRRESRTHVKTAGISTVEQSADLDQKRIRLKLIS